MTESPGNRRLDSWKEIADFLGRDVRTVIRWEKEKALPIHRIPGGKRQGVFAYSEEIQEWMLGQSAPDAAGSAPELPAKPGAPVPHSAPPAGEVPGSRPSRRLRVRVSMGIAAGMVVLTGAAFLWLSRLQSAAAAPPPLERPLHFRRTDYAAAMPRGIAAGDFNRDGKLDLAFTESLHGSLVVLLGDGRGAFPRRITTPTGLQNPEHIALGDFNGDGHLDVALSSYFGGREIEVLLGNGDGGFRQGVRYDVGGRSRCLVAGDLNGDGKLDLAVAGSVAGKIFIMFGKGDGTFLDGGHYDAERDVATLELVDLAGRGALDVVAADYRQATGSSISVYRNKGDGTFYPREIFPAGTGPLGLAVADLNRDGQLDIVTANFPTTGSILMGTPPARFSSPVTFEGGRGNGFVAVADLDRDGLPDIIVLGEHSFTASILLGNGRGGISAAQEVPTGSYPDGLVVADFDGDRRQDLAILNLNGNSISVYLNRTDAAAAWSWFARPTSSHVN